MKKVLTLLKQEIEVLKLIFENKAVSTSQQGETSTGSSSNTTNQTQQILKKLLSGATEKNSKVVNEYKEKLKNLVVPEHAMKVIEEEIVSVKNFIRMFANFCERLSLHLKKFPIVVSQYVISSLCRNRTM